MLHTKSQGHQPSGFVEDFKGFLTYMGVVATYLRDQDHLNKPSFPPSKGVSIWNLSSIGPVVSEEKMFENVGGCRSHWFTISSPRSLRLRWAKMRTNSFKLYIKNEAFDHLIIGSGTLLLPLPLWSYYYGNLGFVTHSSVIVKLPSNKGCQKWELSSMSASRLHRLVNNLCVVMPNGDKIRF